MMMLRSTSRGMITVLIREITFRLSQCTWLQSTNVTDRQTDDIGYDSNNVLRAVKTVSVSRQESRAVAGNPRDAAVIFDP